MDSIPFLEATEVMQATEFILSLTDDQIRAHRAQMQQIFTRIGQVIPRQSVTAEHFLDSITKNLDSVIQFYVVDQTERIILSIPNEGDPLTQILSRRSADRGDFLTPLLKLLCCRWIAFQRREWEKENANPRSRSRPQPKEKRTARPFLKAEGIRQTNPIDAALKRGEKLLNAEDTTELSGISLLFLPSLSLLDHLSGTEQKRLNILLPRYPRATREAQTFASKNLLQAYQTLFNAYVGKGHEKEE
ncbi:hypothetical protein BDV35DRAFT_374210 [Aspergillus flavus]|uniref:Uncharacterized protein n=1 Tax=Aspergillus flavus TaxID=5059 RepID=A0A5N6GGD5_ASPFL|nr:hypothetical protein BDV35DRAFT_374210 [Aspergillus flavus]